MQERAESFNLDYYINLILKRRWLIIIPFCISMLAGIYLAITLPESYEASTVIFVEPQSVPSNYVKAIVSKDIGSRITTIAQQILSRTNLEKAIDKFNLFSAPEQEKLFMEDKIASLRRRTQIEVTRTRGADTFSIIFNGTNPELVMRVANWLAISFINENLKIRESLVSGTSDFLSGELQTMRKRLQEVEASLGRYRKQYMGELPEQLETNLRILDGLQRQLNERQISLRDAKNRHVTFENRIEARRKLQALQMEANKNLRVSSGTKPSQPEKLLTLRELKEQLTSLRASYTDQHPDVIRLKSKIEKLERNAGKLGYGSITELEQNKSENKGQLVADNILADQIQQRSEIKVEIQNLESDIAKIQFQIKDYQKRVEVTPKREEELLSLKRDYQNIQGSYKTLLSRKLEAEIAANMEKKQKGERFRIIDPARLPKKPISPDLRKLFMMAVAAGLGIGAGLIFLMDFLDSSLKDPEKFEDDLGVPVLATIPKVYHQKDTALKRLNQVLTACSLVVMACLIAGFAVLVSHGVEPIMEIVRPYIASLKI